LAKIPATNPTTIQAMMPMRFHLPCTRRTKSKPEYKTDTVRRATYHPVLPSLGAP
jgi:hypothetical protein